MGIAVELLGCQITLYERTRFMVIFGANVYRSYILHIGPMGLGLELAMLVWLAVLDQHRDYKLETG